MFRQKYRYNIGGKGLTERAFPIVTRRGTNWTLVAPCLGLGSWLYSAKVPRG